jgi:chromate reductase
MFKIAVIVGSLRKNSFNRKLALALNKLNHPKLQLSLLKIDDIPLYNQDLDHNLPDSVVRFKNEIVDADAVLFITPEYNRSIPGVLKNIVDWGTRPPGTNVWKKRMAIAGVSPGAVGTAVAQSHLRHIMTSLGAIVFGQPEIYIVYKEGMIDDDHNITVEDTRKFMQGFLDKFADELGKCEL